MDTRVYWLWLQEALGVGAPQSDSILKMFPTAQAVYEAKQLPDSMELSDRQRAALQNHDLSAAKERLRRVLSMGAWLLTPDDVDFPALLRGIYAPPTVLYGKGTCFRVDRLPAVAVVGTRRATPNGTLVTRRLAAGLAAGGAVVVSGGAPGLDCEALTAAMDAGGACISFQACGLDVDYPLATQAVRDRLIREGGMLLSEFPPGVTVRRHHFSIRNRLISGISLGVCVPQAPQKSGALITARFAREQGHDVFAAPGAVGDPLCEGTNELLKDGARLVTCACDILMDYFDRFPLAIDIAAAAEAERQVTDADKKRRSNRQEPPSASAKQTAKTPKEPPPTVVPCPEEANEDAKRIYAALSNEPLSAVELAGMTGLPLVQTLCALTALELCGAAVCTAGQRYALRCRGESV